MVRFQTLKVSSIHYTKARKNNMSGFRMSEQRPTNRNRRSQIKEPISFFFVFSEGVCTEIEYFTKLSESDILKDNISIKVMNRWKSRVTDSNQLNVVKNVKRYMDECKTITRREKNRIKIIFEKLINNTYSGNEIIELLRILEADKDSTKPSFSNDEAFVSQVCALITACDYDSTCDAICIALDRDYESFKEHQYDEAVKIANEYGFKLGISNLNFEVFLLLHISDLSELELSSLKSTSQLGKTKVDFKKILKTKMLEHNYSFHSNNYDASFFVERFKQGLHNSKKHSTNVIDLKNNIGTSLFEILDTIIK